jgi:tetratricopeptide (TPR) repeat protein
LQNNLDYSGAEIGYIHANPSVVFDVYVGLSFALAWYSICASIPAFNPTAGQVVEAIQVIIPFINKHYDALQSTLTPTLLEQLFNLSANIGVSAAEQKQRATAIEAFKLAMKIHAENGIIKAYLSKVYANLGDMKEAEELAREAVKLEPQSLATQYNYYQLLQQQNKLTKEKSLAAVNDLSASISEFMRRYKVVMNSESNSPQSKENVQMMEGSPEFSVIQPAYLLLIQAQQNCNQIHSAYLTSTEWSKSFPLDILPHYHAGRLAIKLNKFAEAQEQLNLAIQLDPHKPEIYYQIALSQFKQNHFSAAEQYLQQAKDQSDILLSAAANHNKSLYPNLPAIHYLSAKLYEKSSQKELAAQQYHHYLTLKPDQLDAAVDYANIVQQLDNSNKYETLVDSLLQQWRSVISSSNLNCAQYFKQHPKQAAAYKNIQSLILNNNFNNNNSIAQHYQELKLLK